MQSNLILEQTQTLSGAQIQSLNILAYTNQELDAFMQTEYLENPLLEASSDHQEETMQNLEKFYETGGEDGGALLPENTDDDVDRRGDVKAQEQGTLERMILEQLHHQRYTADTWKLFRYLVCCLDDSGYFPYEPAEIARVSGYEQTLIEQCLCELKELEPAGIFARDLSECLTLQLRRKGIEDPLLYQMTETCLEEILQGQISRITRQLGISTVKTKEFMHLLSTLNPRPLAQDSRETQYIVPDILAVREGDGWKAELNDRWLGEYHLNDYYIQMMATAEDQELKAYFAEKLKRARYVLECVEQRRTTILRIVYAILDYQKEYFLQRKAPKPMTLEDIGQILSLHPSTVSRAIKGKYLQYQKTILLKDLFSGSVSREDSSAAHVKERILALIQKEEKENTLSDSCLEKLLAADGITVSRRTIAKYREQLGIPDSRMRGYL